MMKQNQKVNHEMDFWVNKQLRHPIIQKHKELLEKMSDERIFCVLNNEPNEFVLLECCDGCFGYEVEREDCLELAEMFREIAEVL